MYGKATYLHYRESHNPEQISGVHDSLLTNQQQKKKGKIKTRHGVPFPKVIEIDMATFFPNVAVFEIGLVISVGAIT